MTSGTGMPLSEPSALRSQSACREGRQTGLPSLHKHVTVSGLDCHRIRLNQWDTGEVALPGPGLRKGLVTPRSLSCPFARVQRCPAFLLGPRDSVVQRSHRGELLAGSGLLLDRRSPVGTVWPGRRVSGPVPVIPGRWGLTGATAKVQTTHRPDSATTRN